MSTRILSPVTTLQGQIKLPGSKSISNRALMMCSLAETQPELYLTALSTANDTVIMQKLLSGLDAQLFDAGDAGTTFRFLAARLAIIPGSHTLTGSARMQERPIAPLVDALRQLGVEVNYIANDGYPPLQIIGKNPAQIRAAKVQLPGDISSQFISALLLIAPYLSDGLRIEVTEPRVSWSYVQMTRSLMHGWGVSTSEDAQGITVPHGSYSPQTLAIEPDWSSASYWLSAAALSQSADIVLTGLYAQDSVQGDAGIVRHYQKIGLQISQTESGVRVKKETSQAPPPRVLTIDFNQMPDMAQTLAVTCTALGISGVFSGLSTLVNKETDRLKALKTELQKLEVSFVKLPAYMSKKGVQFMLEGKAEVPDQLTISTYQDHRMAMAFAPLTFLGKEVAIEHAEVVAKSYPEFWLDWERVCS
jgi:3-phosphoshikimate 1-carboxyvinyltransferase